MPADKTFAERCRIAQECLPQAEYRRLLTALHDDMLAALEANKEDETFPVVIQNKRAPFDVSEGDYVFASRWGDCDPGDPWAVGFVETVDAKHVKLGTSPRFWPCAMKITREQGARICEQYPSMERSPLDYQAIARVFGTATKKE